MHYQNFIHDVFTTVLPSNNIVHIKVHLEESLSQHPSTQNDCDLHSIHAISIWQISGLDARAKQYAIDIPICSAILLSSDNGCGLFEAVAIDADEISQIACRNSYS